jgi:hypothetical protein
MYRLLNEQREIIREQQSTITDITKNCADALQGIQMLFARMEKTTSDKLLLLTKDTETIKAQLSYLVGETANRVFPNSPSPPPPPSRPSGHSSNRKRTKIVDDEDGENSDSET